MGQTVYIDMIVGEVPIPVVSFQAHIPAPLTEEMEAEKRQRDAEKKKLQNQKRKEKMKERKAQQKIEDAAKKEKEKEEEEKQRYLRLSDREKVIPLLPSLCQ